MNNCENLQDDLHGILEELRECFDILDMPTESQRAAALASTVTADRPAKLVVVGEFNSGKSTLVNALCGWNLLPAGITPTTATINIISHADTERIEVVQNDGCVSELPFGQEALRQLTARSGDHADVREVRIATPGIPRGLVLIDTPGVNDVNQTRSEIVYQMIPEADALLFLMDVQQVLKRSEVSFLRDRVLASSMVKTIFVLNHTDRVSKSSEIDAAVAYVRANLSSIYNSVADSLAGSGCEHLASNVRQYASNIPIFTVSAKTMMHSAIARQDIAGDPMGLRSTILQLASPKTRMRTILAGAAGQAAPLIARLRREVEERKTSELTAREGILSALHKDSDVLRKTLGACKTVLETVEVQRRELSAEAELVIDGVFANAATGVEAQVATLGADSAVQAIQQEIGRKLESQMEALNGRVRQLSTECRLKASAFIPLTAAKTIIINDSSQIGEKHGDRLSEWLKDPVGQMFGFGLIMVFGWIGLAAVALPFVAKLFGAWRGNMSIDEMRQRILQAGRDTRIGVTGALNDRLDSIATSVLDILDEPQHRIRIGCAAICGTERLPEATLTALSIRTTSLDDEFGHLASSLQ